MVPMVRCCGLTQHYLFISHGSVLWPLTALFLHSAIFVWLFQGDTCKFHSAVCIFHIFSSFNFLILVQVLFSNITSGFARFKNGRRHNFVSFKMRLLRILRFWHHYFVRIEISF